MNIEITSNTVIVFDLDDTLYKEQDFVLSGFHAVAQYISMDSAKSIADSMFQLYLDKTKDVFGEIIAMLKLSSPDKNGMLRVYREHYPTITLPNESKTLLDKLHNNVQLALITDGRSVTQRNKIKSLGLEKYFSEIAISEETGHDKYSLECFSRLQQTFPDSEFVGIGDNVAKDFRYPNLLGWLTICLKDNGRNVHPQVPSNSEYMPKMWVDSLEDLHFLIKQC